ncbi:hypothetical protein PIB30_014539 [Stylosanthes scabra]|uniref:Uncharacterized protein n=1 Tax=Stylosanthes scabra TaxID=79078 RepID=A0ABU6Y8J1_9FABA|nr:hypothetical protein [Stylosanthes scabra]
MAYTLLQRRVIDLARKMVCRYTKKGRDESPPVNGHILSQTRYSESNYQGTLSSRPIWSMTNPPIHINTSGTLSIEWIHLDLRRGKRVISDRIYHRKQLMTKPMWSRKEIQVIAKKFIYHEEVSQVVITTKNPHTHTAPREPSSSDRERSSNPKIRNPRDEDEEPMTMINVITDSSAVKKSKFVLKKGLKILTIHAAPDMLGDEARKRGLQIRPSRCRRTNGSLGKARIQPYSEDPGFKDSDLKTHRPSVMGLDDHFIKSDGSIELPITIRKGNAQKTTMA